MACTTDEQERDDSFGTGLALEATELRLGPPGEGGGDANKSYGKRGFEETVELKLVLPTFDVEGGGVSDAAALAVAVPPEEVNRNDPEKPSAPKVQVVGWPPVRSFRKNMLLTSQAGKKTEFPEAWDRSVSDITSLQAFVKVGMDGAPYLRKVDLNSCKSYREFSAALRKMFSSFITANSGNDEEERNTKGEMDFLSGLEYVATYEDKDGDWMLVGDVPWKMFALSCKRLRIMKGGEAIGL